MEIENKLKEILSAYKATVIFEPLSSEVDYSDSPLPVHIFKKTFKLPSDKNSDPFVFAAECIEKFKEEKVCVLVPGQAFDIYGTRHGRGLGWYDRFLSRTPKNWLRIGVTDSSKFSKEKLDKKPWDEQMNWILVKDSEGSLWKIYMSNFISNKNKKR